MALLEVLQRVVSLVARHSTQTYFTLTAPELCLATAFGAAAIRTRNAIWMIIRIKEPVSFREPLWHFSLLH